MHKHISYFILKKNHKGFKKGVKTNIRKKLGDFFEITNNKELKKIKFREDKWNKELFEPVYSNHNISHVKNDLIRECNELSEFVFDKKIEKFGLNISITIRWVWESYYEIGEVKIFLDKNFYNTTLYKQIGLTISDSLKQNDIIIESLVKKEIKQSNENLSIFLNKCLEISKEVGFDVYDSFLN